MRRRLVLSRKKNERIILTLEDGRTVDIVVVEAMRGLVRLGIEAAAEIKVHRQEVNERIVKSDRRPMKGTSRHDDEGAGHGRGIAPSPRRRAEDGDFKHDPDRAA